MAGDGPLSTMVPAQRHSQTEPSVSAGIPSTSTFDGGIQGSTTIGMQGAGIGTPMAAAVSIITSGFRGEWHRMNPGIFTNGMMSKIVPTGTGKTWLAIEQARRWAEAGERVCFVSYTRGVIEMVQKIFAEMPERSQPAFVGTFHYLGYQWGVEPGHDAGWDFWETEAVDLALAAAACLPPEERFTAFVVDEAQDFADSWWPALLASAASSEFKLAVFKDDEQVVFSDRSGRPDLPMLELTLDDNLRNSQQIVDTFRPLISADVRAKAGPAYPVEYVDCHLTEVIGAADDVVANLVEHRGWLPEQVVLLTTAHRHPVHVELGDDKTRYWKELRATDL